MTLLVNKLATAFILGILLGSAIGALVMGSHMKRWQDDWYAAHPVVKEVPAEQECYDVGGEWRDVREQGLGGYPHCVLFEMHPPKPKNAEQDCKAHPAYADKEGFMHGCIWLGEIGLQPKPNKESKLHGKMDDFDRMMIDDAYSQGYLDALDWTQHKIRELLPVQQCTSGMVPAESKP